MVVTVVRYAALLLLLLCQLSLAQVPESIPEAEGEPEGKPEGEPIPEGEAPPYAEPEPQWETAKVIWGLAWKIHVYGFGAMFALIAIYSLVSIARLWNRKNLLSQPYFLALNFLVLLLAVSRSVYLFVDAYNSNALLPPLAAYLLNAVVFPCLTSTFSLMFSALLAATRMTFISKSVTSAKLVAVVIAVHFLLSFTTDILTGLHLDARVLLFVCQVFYVLWGLVIFFGFTIIFSRLYKAALLRQNLMDKHTSRKLGLSNKQHKPPKLTLSLGVKVTLVSAIFGLATVALLVYGMVDVYGVFNYKSRLEPWKWWAYHTTFRLLEIAICITISFVATQPFRYPSAGLDNSRPCCFCVVCGPWCRKEPDDLLNDVSWSDFKCNTEFSTSLQRNESQKGDLPLHHMRRQDQQAVSPTKSHNTPMLKADHGQLLFSSREQDVSADAVDNGSLLLGSASLVDQATLKIDRDLLPNDRGDNFDDRSELLSYSQVSVTDSNSATPRFGSRRMNADLDVSATNSQNSLSQVSQLSPELDSVGDLESSELLADV